VKLRDFGQPTGEQSGLQTRTAVTESVLLRVRTKSSARFWNLTWRCNVESKRGRIQREVLGNHTRNVGGSQMKRSNPFCAASLSHGDRCETPPVYKKLRTGVTANIWSHHEMKVEGVVREKLGVLFRRFVLFAQNSGDEFGEYVRENLVVLFRRFLLFAWDVRCNRESHNNCEPRPKVEWPYVMNSSVAMQGPLISATWIWYHLHRHWHHGYYRARR
jgi:hypothetical protein